MSFDFTLRQLEYAVAVARHLNFGEAARACHVSQPSLSAQIAQLEGVLGVQLFERGRRGAALTPIGADVVEAARDLLARTKHLEDLARAGKTPLTGELRLGVIPTVAPFVLPPLMAALKARYPELRPYLVEGQTDHLVRRLMDGELDGLLLALEADLGAAESVASLRDPFVLAMPPDHPLAARACISLTDIPPRELLLLEEGHCLAQQVEEVCALAGAAEAGDFRAASLVTLVQMVAAGMGVTLLPGIGERSELTTGAGIVTRPLSDAACRTIGLAWRPGSPRRVELELLAELVAEVATPAPWGAEDA